jgi:hypothetical protein
MVDAAVAVRRLRAPSDWNSEATNNDRFTNRNFTKRYCFFNYFFDELTQ